MSTGGKGDKPRPLSVDTKTFDSNWDRIFGKKEQRYEEDGQSKTSKTSKEENKKKRQSQRQDL